MSDIEQQVEEAMAKGKFSIVDAIRNRSYPKDKVFVYLDEQDAYDAAKLDEEIKNTEASTPEYDVLVSKKDELLKQIDANKYVFVISGISEGDREKLQLKSAETYPIEYAENKNQLTGEVTRTEVSSPERDRLFTNLLWVSSIKEVIAPDGSTQDTITLEDVFEMRQSLPIAATGTITESIEKLRISTAIFMMKVNEDFLAKS